MLRHARFSKLFSHSAEVLAAAAMLAACTAFPLAGLGQAAAPVTPPATAEPGATLMLTTPPTVTSTTPPVPATPTAPASPSVPAVSPAASVQEAPPVTQSFVATITADKVYVRSGPGTAYYEMGQLGKGDLVYVVGSSRGWYEILPPNGSFCVIAKEFVDVDAAGSTGTVKGDYINVRAGTAINKTRDPSAVLTVVRKGTKLAILGSSDKYYEIAPPDRAFVYISPQFVVQAANARYVVPQLKLPEGAKGPTVSTVEAPTSPPAVAGATGLGSTGPGGAPAVAGAEPAGATLIIPLPGSIPNSAPTGNSGPAPIMGSGVAAGTAATGTPAAEPVTPSTPLPPLVPKVTFSETATARFKDVNSRYQEEAKKPPAQQSVDGFLKDFKDLLAMENLSPSVKAGAEADVSAIERTLTVQRLVQEQATADAMTKQQSEALRAQYDAAEKALAAAKTEGPYAAEGVLKSSTIVTGKYTLVNPQTGRVVAYVDPAAASVDVGSLIGKYIGVRGISKKMEGSEITVIQVSNATLMPEPK